MQHQFPHGHTQHLAVAQPVERGVTLMRALESVQGVLEFFPRRGPAEPANAAHGIEQSGVAHQYRAQILAVRDQRHHEVTQLGTLLQQFVDGARRVDFLQDLAEAHQHHPGMPRMRKGLQEERRNLAKALADAKSEGPRLRAVC